VEVVVKVVAVVEVQADLEQQDHGTAVQGVVGVEHSNKTLRFRGRSKEETMGAVHSSNFLI